jgi:hypothetical protein
MDLILWVIIVIDSVHETWGVTVTVYLVDKAAASRVCIISFETTMEYVLLFLCDCNICTNISIILLTIQVKNSKISDGKHIYLTCV